MKIIFILLFITSQTFAQTIDFTGKLLDAETQKPVVYANISFLKENKGISTTENGTFNLEIEEKLLQEKIHISCLNYKDTIVTAQEVFNKTFLLRPKSFELEEIVISKKVDRELIVDKYKRRNIKSSFGARQSSPWIVTKYFKYEKKYDNTPYLKTITVYFGSLIDRKKSKFGIRIYKVDSSTGYPSDDLVNEKIIGFSRKVDGKVEIDVSKYEIEIPKDGLFIGLERFHIPYNFYEYNYTMKGSKKKNVAKAVAPSFGAVYTKDTTFYFSRGKWRKFYSPQIIFKGNQIKPAISLTLSN